MSITVGIRCFVRRLADVVVAVFFDMRIRRPLESIPVELGARSLRLAGSGIDVAVRVDTLVRRFGSERRVEMAVGFGRERSRAAAGRERRGAVLGSGEVEVGAVETGGGVCVASLVSGGGAVVEAS